MLSKRRNFLKLMATAIAGGFVGEYKPAIQTTVPPLPRVYQGNDLSGWEVALGDGVCVAPGEPPPDENDIETIHYGSYSVLRANIQRRRIMAHNITFKRIVDDEAFQFIHHCSYKFRLPYLPNQNNTDMNGETLEGGIFIWDGSKTRLDYGIAFQWILNPWKDNFGGIRTWTDTSGGEWVLVGELPPDTEWHEVRMIVDFRRETTALLIDGMHCLTRFTGTPKPETWGTETAARFQAEIISLNVCDQGNGMLHEAYFKDWAWFWEPCVLLPPPLPISS